MRTYTVHANASLPRDETRFCFVKEGIAWGALVSPLIWFLYHRLWWEAAITFALSVLLALGGDALSMSENAVLVAGIMLQFLIAFEANDLRRLALSRRAYQSVAVIHAQNEAEAELRFFSSWTGALPGTGSVATSSSVFDRSGESGNLATALTVSRTPVWPRASERQSPARANLNTDPSYTSSATPGEEVLGLFPKPQQ